MQPNPFPEDMKYGQPTEPNPPTPQYLQEGQYVPTPYQGQQGQPIPPSYQYTNPPPPVQQSSAMSDGSSRRYTIGKIIDFIRWIIVALELLFLLRFVLELIGADPNNIFAQFLYKFTGFFLYPFLGIVPNTYIGKNGAFIDWSTLIGMAVYGILYWILRLFLRTTVSRPEEPIE
ncbi:MAG TPA: YggT family protein [Ktedonobacteraceae bacterium]|jgi:YggT family protein|nr:YggT family protein [Ktedonobacteraceae bacterium]